ncbi:MAG: guanylate kinase [Selenomonadales bacterium]|jgi:guanylate kinase|nr:guanylate kinase [Selenomonadales bacterium]MBQ2245874.1 guanylate kinase [Selenomonadales bacterium]MBR0325967.1 guanylate kinase [Selenomonadales bacterium]
MQKEGLLIVVSGPSGAGKGTICKRLLEKNPNLGYSISATTRAPRTGEVNGVNYWFLSKEEFQKMIAEDGLLEWAEVYGNYYGTPAQKVRDSLAEGKNILLEIDTQGAALVRKKFPEGVYIYILPPSLEELKRRIIGRGTDSAESIERRLSCAREEMGCASEQYNYLVLNDEVELAVERVETIIEAEQYQIKRNLNLLQAVCGE